MLACSIYIRLEDIETLRSNSRLGLLALVVMLNLTAVRASYEMSSMPFFVENSSAAALLPYLAPTALAPVIVALLIDAGSAVFMALLISIFTGVIYGNRLDLLVLTFLASMVAILCTRQTRKRGSIVRATTLGGVVVATFALLIGVIDRLPPVSVMQQMAAGLFTGVLTGVVVVGLLPLVESLFKRTTDITLIELADFNHPLLRRIERLIHRAGAGKFAFLLIGAGVVFMRPAMHNRDQVARLRNRLCQFLLCSFGDHRQMHRQIEPRRQCLQPGQRLRDRNGIIIPPPER